jgi:hypothetical protein
VIEDAPERLVLETRGSRYLATVVCVAFGAILLGADYAVPDLPMVVGLLGWSLLACGAFSFLNWRRFTFDTRKGSVQFNSLFHGSWSEPLGAIRGTDVATREVQRRDNSGATYTDTLFIVFLLVGNRRVQVNQAMGATFVEDLRKRVDAFRSRWQDPGKVEVG